MTSTEQETNPSAATPENTWEDLWRPGGLLAQFSHLDGDDEILAGITERRGALLLAAHDTDDSGWTDTAEHEYDSLDRARSIIKNKGIAGMQRMIELQQKSLAPLPEGYTYDTSLRIPGDELATLKELVGWKRGNIANFELALDTYDMGNFNVGVRTTEGNLIGYGRLVYADDHGHLCDFMVDPKHRRQGIGMAIIDTRLAMAKASGITSLYMPIDDDNTLRHYYLENGFYELEANLIARGPDPMPLVA